jgi:hypothetical protein
MGPNDRPFRKEDRRAIDWQRLVFDPEILWIIGAEP